MPAPPVGRSALSEIASIGGNLVTGMQNAEMEKRRRAMQDAQLSLQGRQVGAAEGQLELAEEKFGAGQAAMEEELQRQSDTVDAYMPRIEAQMGMLGQTVTDDVRDSLRNSTPQELLAHQQQLASEIARQREHVRYKQELELQQTSQDQMQFRAVQQAMQETEAQIEQNMTEGGAAMEIQLLQAAMEAKANGETFNPREFIYNTLDEQTRNTYEILRERYNVLLPKVTGLGPEQAQRLQMPIGGFASTLDSGQTLLGRENFMTDLAEIALNEPSIMLQSPEEIIRIINEETAGPQAPNGIFTDLAMKGFPVYNWLTDFMEEYQPPEQPTGVQQGEQARGAAATGFMRGAGHRPSMPGQGLHLGEQIKGFFGGGTGGAGSASGQGATPIDDSTASTRPRRAGSKGGQ